MNSEGDDADVIVVGCGPVGETREAVLDDDVIAGLLAPWGTTDQLKIDRTALYRFHANVAETFHEGPVFLAGDAAHQIPPFNGPGRCSGMRDAANLAWKLATVANGYASNALLDAHDSDAALEAGYGQRPFPKMTGATMIVRPDHYIAAVTTDLVEATQQVASILQPSELPVRQ